MALSRAVSTVDELVANAAPGHVLARGPSGYVSAPDRFNVVAYAGGQPIGDGATDATAALQAAATAGGANATVFFPKGTYLVAPAGASSPVINANLAGVTFLGEPGAIIKLKTGSPTNSVVIQINAADVSVKGLTFDLNNQAQAFGVHVRTGGDRAHLKGNKFINGEASGCVGVKINGTASRGFVHENDVTGVRNGVLSDAASTCSRWLVAHNDVDGTGTTLGTGIQFNAPSSAGQTDITVVGNKVANIPYTSLGNGLGIAFANVQRGVICENTVRSCGDDGIHVEDGTTDVAIGGNVVTACGNSGIGVNSSNASRLTKRIAVTGNAVEGCLTARGTGGILLGGNQSLHDCVVGGNSVRNCGRAGAECYGIDVQFGAVGHRVTDNIVSKTLGSTTAGIRLAAAVNVRIAGNRCWDDTGGPQDYGLVVQGAQTDTHVLDNDFSGNGTGGIDESGIGTKTRYVRRNNAGHVTENAGATSVADGGTIAHGLVSTPTFVRATPSVAGEFASITALGATTFTCAIKKHDGTAGTTQTVYWEAAVT